MFTFLFFCPLFLAENLPPCIPHKGLTESGSDSRVIEELSICNVIVPRNSELLHIHVPGCLGMGDFALFIHSANLI